MTTLNSPLDEYLQTAGVTACPAAGCAGDSPGVEAGAGTGPGAGAPGSC